MNNDWLDIGILEDYLDGKLDAKTMNRVEREALEDPFVAEALAGLSESPKRSLQSLSILQKQLQERIATEQTGKKTRVITWQRLSIAATAAVLFISVSIVFWMKENVRQQQLANRAKKVEVNLAPIAPDTTPAAENEALAKLKPSAQHGDAASADASKLPIPTNAVAAEIDQALRAAKANRYAANRTKKEKIEVAAAPQQQQAATMSMARIAPSATVWSGKVADAEGAPLPGVVVRAEGSALSAITDTNGQFSLRVDSTVKTDKIKLTALGFEAKELIASANQPMDIRLVESNNMLNEVAMNASPRRRKALQDTPQKAEKNIAETLSGKVAGVRVSDRNSFDNAVSKPVKGWDEFFKYLDKENRFNQEPLLGKQVELSFLIRKDGRPADLKVLKGIAGKYDEEAIRLILKGPKWEQTKAAGDRMTFSISF